MQLKPRFLNAQDIYPGGRQVDYGAATMVVHYVLNDQGETLDDQTEIDAERSTVSISRHSDLFAEATRELVNSWEFDFSQAEAGSCERSQKLTSQIRFSRR